jgi:hypothetical protein
MHCSAIAASTNKPCRAPVKLTDGEKLYCLRHGNKKTMKRVERNVTEDNVLDLVKNDMDPSIVCVKRFPYAGISYVSGYYPVYISAIPEKDEFRKPGSYFPGLALDAEPVVIEGKEYFCFAEFVNMHSFSRKGIDNVCGATSHNIQKKRGRTEIPKRSKYLCFDENGSFTTPTSPKQSRDILSATYASLLIQHPDFSALKSLYQEKGAIQIVGYGASEHSNLEDSYTDLDTFFGAEAILAALLTDNILWDSKTALKAKYQSIDNESKSNNESNTNVLPVKVRKNVILDSSSSTESSPIASPRQNGLLTESDLTRDLGIILSDEDKKRKPSSTINLIDTPDEDEYGLVKKYTTLKQTIYELPFHTDLFACSKVPRIGDSVFRFDGHSYVPYGIYDIGNVVKCKDMAKLDIIEDSVKVVRNEFNNNSGVIIDVTSSEASSSVIELEETVINLALEEHQPITISSSSSDKPLGEFRPLPTTGNRKAKNSSALADLLPPTSGVELPSLPQKSKTSTTFFLRGTNPK